VTGYVQLLQQVARYFYWWTARAREGLLSERQSIIIADAEGSSVAILSSALSNGCNELPATGLQSLLSSSQDAPSCFTLDLHLVAVNACGLCHEHTVSFQLPPNKSTTTSSLQLYGGMCTPSRTSPPNPLNPRRSTCARQCPSHMQRNAMFSKSCDEGTLLILLLLMAKS